MSGPSRSREEIAEAEARWRELLAPETRRDGAVSISHTHRYEVVARAARLRSLEEVAFTSSDALGQVHVCAATIGDRVGSGNNERLATTFGASLSAQAAREKAIMEALEVVSIERPAGATEVACYSDLEQACVYPPSLLLFSEEELESSSFPFRRYSDEMEIEWILGYDVTRGRATLVPAECVFTCMSARQPLVSVDTTGGSARDNMYEAVLHGLYEVVERDALMLTWLKSRAAKPLDLAREEVGLAALLSRLAWELGGQLWAFEITTDVRIPTFLVLLLSSGVPGGMLVGAGANIRKKRGLERAILELLLSAKARLSGRVPVGADADVEDWRERLAFLFGPHPRAGYHEDRQTFASGELELCVALLRSSGLRVLAVDCTRPEVEAVGISCVRVLVPWMQPRYVNDIEPRRLGSPRLNRLTGPLHKIASQRSSGLRTDLHPFL